MPVTPRAVAAGSPHHPPRRSPAAAAGAPARLSTLRLQHLSLQQVADLAPGQLTDQDVVCVDTLAPPPGAAASGIAGLGRHVPRLIEHFEPAALAQRMPHVEVPLFEQRAVDGTPGGHRTMPLPQLLGEVGSDPLTDKSGAYAVVHWADEVGDLSTGVRLGQGDCIAYNDDWQQLLRQAAGPMQEPLQQLLQLCNVDRNGRRPARPDETIHGLVLSQGYSRGAPAHRHGSNVFLQLHGVTEWWLLGRDAAETMMDDEPQWLPGGLAQWHPAYAEAMRPASLQSHGGVVGRDDLNLLHLEMRPGMLLRIGKDVVHQTHKHWGYNAALTWVTRLHERSE